MLEGFAGRQAHHLESAGVAKAPLEAVSSAMRGCGKDTCGRGVGGSKGAWGWGRGGVRQQGMGRDDREGLPWGRCVAPSAVTQDSLQGTASSCNGP